METRNETIEKLICDYLRVTSKSWNTYSEEVLTHYHETVHEDKRSIVFHVNGDTYRNMKMNGQLINRYVSGDTRMPVELEESLIEVLPNEWRNPLKTALAARMGLLASPIPSNEPAIEIQHIGQLAKEFGDLFEALGVAYEDNTLDHNDAHLVDKILKEGGELMNMVNSVMHKARSIKSKSNVHVLHKAKGGGHGDN